MTRLNIVQLQLLEHGFNERFRRYDDLTNWKAIQQMYAAGPSRYSTKKTDEVKAIQLDDLYFVFRVYLMLIQMYLLVFAVELLLCKWHKKRGRKLVLPKRKRGKIMHRKRTKRAGGGKCNNS